jgi:hypothetical protein
MPIAKVKMLAVPINTKVLEDGNLKKNSCSSLSGISIPALTF